MTPRCVLIVTQFYAPEKIGSAPVMAETAEWLAAHGFEVTVLAARPHYPEMFVPAEYRRGARDRETVNGVRLVRLPVWPLRGGGLLARLWIEGWLLLGALWRRAVEPRLRRPLVLSLCPSIFTVLAAHAFVARGGRHVAVVHDIQSGLAGALGIGALGPVPRLLRWLERTALNRTDAIVVLSDGMRDALRSNGIARPITVLPPQVNTETIRPQPRPDGQPPTLLYSGNLGRKQGIEQVLDMAARLASLMPAARVVIRGNGNQEDQLKARAGELGLANLSFAPLAPTERIAAAMAEGDVHLVPQVPDGANAAVPSKVFAIMAAGRPFIATAVPGSTLDHVAQASGAGVCVPPNDPDAFAAAAVALLNDGARRAAMGAAGRAWVEANASNAAIMKSFAAVLAG